MDSPDVFLVELANPLLGVAKSEIDDVAGVEIHPHAIASDIIEELHPFTRRKEEAVLDIFQRDADPDALSDVGDAPRCVERVFPDGFVGLMRLPLPRHDQQHITAEDF